MKVDIYWVSLFVLYFFCVGLLLGACIEMFTKISKLERLYLTIAVLFFPISFPIVIILNKYIDKWISE